MTRRALEPAYLLHRRPFRDSSQIIDVLCVHEGRVPLLARGLNRRRRGGSLATLLQPFRPLLISYAGRGELAVLGNVESAGELPPLSGDALLSGLYLNELLIRLLHRHEAHPGLFTAYGEALGSLGAGLPLEATLRRFEFILLEELGYWVDLSFDHRSGAPVNALAHYALDPHAGLCAVDANAARPGECFRGADLLAIAEGRYQGESAPAAKRLMRELLAPHLGDRPLRSRAMFSAARRPSEAEC